MRSRRRLSHLEDHEFLKELTAIDGKVAGLLNEPSMWSTFMPMLRSDFLATESYLHIQKNGTDLRLHTPTLLLWGREDGEANHFEVDAWKHWFSHIKGPVAMAGDHFYLIQDPNAFLDCIYQFWVSSCAS